MPLVNEPLFRGPRQGGDEVGFTDTTKKIDRITGFIAKRNLK